MTTLTFRPGIRVTAFTEKWRGKVRRVHESGNMLIEWSYCAGLPTDICTWISVDDVIKGGK